MSSSTFLGGPGPPFHNITRYHHHSLAKVTHKNDIIAPSNCLTQLSQSLFCCNNKIFWQKRPSGKVSSVSEFMEQSLMGRQIKAVDTWSSHTSCPESEDRSEGFCCFISCPQLWRVFLYQWTYIALRECSQACHRLFSLMIPDAIRLTLNTDSQSNP